MRIDEYRHYPQVLSDAQIAKIAGVESKTYTATISGETTWDAIVWDPALEGEPEATDVLELTGSGTSAALTFGSAVSYGCTLTLKGDAIKIKAGDSIYEDGCWIKEFAKFGTLTCETEPTFADIKEGYNGAYAKTSTGFTLRAQNKEVISINFANGQSVSGTDYTGLAPVQGDTWMNMTTTWGSGGKTVDLGTIKATADGATTEDVSGATGSCYAANTYGWNSATDVFLKGYLDDGGNHAQVTVTDIPYSTYDVIVYCATDSGSKSFRAVTVNGTAYTYDSENPGMAKAGSDNWGASQNKTAVYGTNAIRIRNLTTSALTIVGGSNGNGARGGIAAIQIVCTGDIVEGTDFTATITDSTAFSAIQWDGGKTFEGGSLNTATITVGEGEGEVAIDFGDGSVTLKTLKIIGTRDVKLVATAALSNVGSIDLSACTGNKIYAYPVSALATSADANLAYAGGTAGDAAVGISHGAAGTTLNLVGGTYKLSETHSDVDVTYNVTDSVLNYTDCTGLGKGTYNIGGTSQINTPKFVLVQGSGNSDTFNLTNDAQVTVSGTTIADSNQNSVMFGHWGGDSTFTISDNASFTAEGTQILIGKTGGTHTINVNGGTITTKGIKAAGYATGTNTLNLAGGALVLGEVGIAAYANTINVNVTADSRITSSAATKITQPIAIAEGKALALDATNGDIVISGAITGEGSIRVVGGTVIFMTTTGLDPNKVATEGGAAFFGVTVSINDMGKYTPVAPLTTDNVKLFDAAGNPVVATVVDDHFEFDWNYTDGACWWDYEFDGNGDNTGSEGTALSWDGGRPKTEGAYVDFVTNIVEQGEAAVTNISLKVPQRPWRDVSTRAWPAEATYMFYGKMVGKDYAYQLAFGSKNNSGNQLFFATRSVADGTVDLCYSINGAEPSVLCTMNVPNAQESDHLYAVVIKDDGNGNSVVNTYLDGKLLQPYTHEGKITLGGGFQIASGHGGTVAGDYGRPDNDDPATIDWLRVYDVEMNAAVMDALAEIYPYISTNGKATRTVTSADTTWVADGKWQQAQYEAETLTTNAPFANTMVEVTVKEATTLALNLEENANYEALEIKGQGTLTLTGADGAVVPSVSGATTIGTDVTVAYGAIKFGNVMVEDGKTLTFDCASLDLGKEFASCLIKLTGVATLGEEAKIEAVNIKATTGRTAELVYDEHTQQYAISVTVADHPFVYTDEGWTWAGESVDVADVEANASVAIVKQGAGMLEWPIDRAAFTVEGGTLRVTGVTKSGSAVTVGGGATLDLNGNKAKEMVLTLDGGKVANSGGAITESNQIKTITLTADSEVSVENAYEIYAASYNTKTTIALGEYTLAKTGAGQLKIVNTLVTGTGAFDVREGSVYCGESTVFDDTATLKIGENGTWEQREGNRKTYVTKIVGEGGTLNVIGKISDFTLTGTLTITNSGSFGTITNMTGAVVNLRQKRNLVFAGEGTVNVALTDTEVQNSKTKGTAITVFTLAEGATTKIGKVTDGSGKDITDSCSITAGGTINVRNRGLMLYVN